MTMTDDPWSLEESGSVDAIVKLWVGLTSSSARISSSLSSLSHAEAARHAQQRTSDGSPSPISSTAHSAQSMPPHSAQN